METVNENQVPFAALPTTQTMQFTVSSLLEKNQTNKKANLNLHSRRSLSIYIVEMMFLQITPAVCTQCLMAIHTS